MEQLTSLHEPLEGSYTLAGVQQQLWCSYSSHSIVATSVFVAAECYITNIIILLTDDYNTP